MPCCHLPCSMPRYLCDLQLQPCTTSAVNFSIWRACLPGFPLFFQRKAETKIPVRQQVARRSEGDGEASAWHRSGGGGDRRAMEGLVSVDKFSAGSQAYFLTHLHQDHTRGLASAGGWRHGPLYCSPITARLLPTRFPGIDASLLRPLASGVSATLSLSSPTSDSPLSLRVTAIPALHCPGTLPSPLTLLIRSLSLHGWF